MQVMNIPQRKLRKQFKFTVSSKRIKYLGMNLAKKKKCNIYTLKTAKHCWKNLKI